MNVQPVNSTNRFRNYYNYSINAGYGALGMGGLCLIQGMRHKKSHKFFGLLALILASVHIGLMEFLHRKSTGIKSDKIA